MVGPHFITSDNVMQKGIVFLMIPVKKVVTDAQTFMPILSVSWFGTHLAQTLWT